MPSKSMLTITYETIYTSDKRYVITLRHKDYPGQAHRVILECPGEQYFPQIRSLFADYGFSFVINDEI